MKIVILAAGEGKRMWPIVTDKYLLPFLGKPLFYHTLKRLKDNIEFDQAIIVTKQETKEQIGQIAQELEIPFQITLQAQPKGMADALLAAKEHLDGEILIINAEDVLEGALYKQVVEKGRTGLEAAFGSLVVDKYFPGGYIKHEGERVRGIVEKPGEGNEPSNLVKLVVDYFKDAKKLVEYLEKTSSEADDVYELALDQMIRDGSNIAAESYEGVWYPLKYPWHVLDITAYFLSNIEQKVDPGAAVSEKAIVKGAVVIEAGAKVFEGAVIKGPVYIGKNCIIGNNTMIRDSILGEGCVTGFNSDITRSYIGANSWFHTNYIGDSVIEGDFGMGSGAVLANLRLDDSAIKASGIDTGKHKLGLMAGKGSRVGVNASTMPGIKIGSNSLVGPGVVLHEDLKDNTKVLVKQELQISDHAPALTSYDQFRKKI